MSTKAVFTMKLEPDLRDYIEQRRHERAYSEYLGRKVGKARALMLEGQGRSHEAVEADFAARRAKLAEGSA